MTEKGGGYYMSFFLELVFCSLGCGRRGRGKKI